MKSFLKIFFHLLYNSFAWAYDLVAAVVSLGKWNQWIEKTIPFIQGPDILELGHGTGHLQLFLIKRKYHPFGLDPSKQMGRITRKRILHCNHIPGLVQATSQSMPFASNSFNTVVATFPTQYIIHSSTITEILRVLKPDGNLVVLMSVLITGTSLIERVLALLYKITEQAPPPDIGYDGLLSKISPVGLKTEIHWIETPSYHLLLILAVKA